jgi:hypothetical protein
VALPTGPTVPLRRLRHRVRFGSRHEGPRDPGTHVLQQAPRGHGLRQLRSDALTLGVFGSPSWDITVHILLDMVHFFVLLCEYDDPVFLLQG